MRAYETDLDSDLDWAIAEGSAHFERRSAVHEALHRIARRLDGRGIPYAVAGGMALFSHGFRRFTDDIDMIVTREGLNALHKELVGLGYLPVFAGSKSLRDTELGVRIEFLVTGEYPGDGKPKPVAFPDPEIVAVEREGIRYVSLLALIELKLASGMTSPGRMRDLADVQELMKLLDLPVELADRLDPYVRAKYRELWAAVRQEQGRFVRVWPHRPLSTRAETLDDLIAALPDAAPVLGAMKADGVTLDSSRSSPHGPAYLVTTDPDVARRHDMHDERDVMDVSR